MASKAEFTGKRLFLLRHATAMPNSEEGDKGRHLAPKGKEEAVALGVTMAKKGYCPDVVLCSSAVRTKQTLEGVQENLSIGNTSFHDILYNGGTGDYLYEIQNVDDSHNSILMVAHNPCIYELAILLAAQGHESVLQRLSEGYKPGSLSVIHCKADKWADIQPAENELVSLIDPLDYNAPARPTRWM